MAVVVYLETENGNFKKSALELSSYGRKLADETKLIYVVLHSIQQILLKFKNMELKN